MVVLLAFVLPSIGLAQPIDISCEIEGSEYFDYLRQTHPAAGTLIYRIDVPNRSIKNIAGIFANDPITKTEFLELEAVADQAYPQLTRVPGLSGFRVIRLNRGTGRFAILHDVRDAKGKSLSQDQLDAANAALSGPDLPLLRSQLGLALSGKCAARANVF